MNAINNNMRIVEKYFHKSEQNECNELNAKSL